MPTEVEGIDTPVLSTDEPELSDGVDEEEAATKRKSAKGATSASSSSNGIDVTGEIRRLKVDSFWGSSAI